MIASVAPHIAQHGLGGRHDLPLPLTWVLVGAIAALLVSFAAMARVTSVPPARTLALPGLTRVVDSTAARTAVRALGLALFLFTGWLVFFGPDLETNPALGIVYVWLWVGIVPASLLLGPVWQLLSPMRTINRLLWRLAGAEGTRPYPARLGLWPGALTLLAFTWLELISPHNTEMGTIRMWFAVYVAVLLVGGQIWGDGFLAHTDPFEVYSRTVARLSPWGRDAQGRVLLRSPLASLDASERTPGLIAVVAVLFGTITYDSFRGSTPWLHLTQSNSYVIAHTWAAYAIDNVALFCFPLLVAGLYLAGTRPVSRGLPAAVAPSVVPIVAGYVMAHYLSYLWEGGQATLFGVISYLGGPEHEVSYWFAYHGTTLAVLKVLFVIGGHVIGVVAAHRAAVIEGHGQRSQVPLLAVMIAFTLAGLYLLFAA